MLALRSTAYPMLPAVVLCIAVLPSLGQKVEDHWHDANAREIQAHQLTMDEVRRLLKTEFDLVQAAKATPQDIGAYEYDESNIAQIDDVAAAASHSPKQLAILKNNGFNPHTFALAQISWIQTSLAVSLLNGGSKVQYVEDVFCANPQNIQFFKANQEALMTLLSKFSKDEGADQDAQPKPTNNPSGK